MSSIGFLNSRAISSKHFHLNASSTAVPNLIDAPVKSTVPISIVHNSIIDAFQIIGRNLKDKADTEKDNMERLSLITRMLSMFSLGELRNLWQEVKLQSTVIQ